MDLDVLTANTPASSERRQPGREPSKSAVPFAEVMALGSRKLDADSADQRRASNAADDTRLRGRDRADERHAINEERRAEQDERRADEADEAPRTDRPADRHHQRKQAESTGHADRAGKTAKADAGRPTATDRTDMPAEQQGDEAPGIEAAAQTEPAAENDKAATAAKTDAEAATADVTVAPPPQTPPTVVAADAAVATATVAAEPSQAAATEAVPATGTLDPAPTVPAPSTPVIMPPSGQAQAPQAQDARNQIAAPKTATPAEKADVAPTTPAAEAVGKPLPTQAVQTAQNTQSAATADGTAGEPVAAEDLNAEALSRLLGTNVESPVKVAINDNDRRSGKSPSPIAAGVGLLTEQTAEEAVVETTAPCLANTDQPVSNAEKGIKVADPAAKEVPQPKSRDAALGAVNKPAAGAVAAPAATTGSAPQTAAPTTTTTSAATPAASVGDAGSPVVVIGQTAAPQHATSLRPAASAPQAAPQAHQPQVVDQVRVQLTKAITEGKDAITISLRPATLGRVDIRLEVQDGRASAVVTADNKDTLALLQKDVQGLEQALSDAGLKTDQQSLSFNLRDQPQQNQQDAQSGRPGRAFAHRNATEESRPEPQQPQPREALWGYNGKSGINIKV